MINDVRRMPESDVKRSGALDVVFLASETGWESCIACVFAS